MTYQVYENSRFRITLMNDDNDFWYSYFKSAQEALDMIEYFNSRNLGIKALPGAHLVDGNEKLKTSIDFVKEQNDDIRSVLREILDYVEMIDYNPDNLHMLSYIETRAREALEQEKIQ